MPFITQGKTNLKYILIVVVLAIIVGGGILGYYYSWIKDLEVKLAELELKLPVVKPPGDATANWKTYRNEKYGHEIKYPTDWYHSVSDYNGQQLTCFNPEGVHGDCTVILTVDWRIAPISMDLEDEYTKRRQFWENSITCLLETCSVEQFYKTPNECKGKCQVSESDILVAGKKGKAIIIQPTLSGLAKEVLFEDKGYIFRLSGELEIIDQMLSTFKFLE